MKSILRRFAANAGLSAVVFLPAFFVASWFQIIIVDGWPRNQSLASEISSWLFFYILFIIPVLLGSLAYSVVTFTIPTHWTRLWRRVVAIVLALLVPGVDFIFHLMGERIYLGFWIPMIIAVILYGMASRVESAE